MSEALIFMNIDTFVFYAFIIGGYIFMGFLISAIVGSFYERRTGKICICIIAVLAVGASNRSYISINTFY